MLGAVLSCLNNAAVAHEDVVMVATDVSLCHIQHLIPQQELRSTGTPLPEQNEICATFQLLAVAVVLAQAS